MTLKFDLVVKYFNLGCYLMMVDARRVLLSSDNSYFLLKVAKFTGDRITEILVISSWFPCPKGLIYAEISLDKSK